MTISSSDSRLVFRVLLLSVALVLLASACGSSNPVATPGDADPTIPIGAPPTGPADPVDPGDTVPAPLPGGGGDVADPGGEVTDDGFLVVENSDGIVDPRPVPVVSLTASDDGSMVKVRFETGVRPCTLSRASAIETEDTVEIILETGLPKNAAAVSCIAMTQLFQIELVLDAPLGDRELLAGSGIVGDEGDDVLVPGPELGADGMLPPAYVDSYVGLELGAALARADVDGVEIRIARQDAESFALTEDLRGNRINVEVDDDVITAVANW